MNKVEKMRAAKAAKAERAAKATRDAAREAGNAAAREGKAMAPCMCSGCGATAVAREGTAHFGCRGFRVLPGKNLPAMFAGLKHPRGGVWMPRP